MKGASFFHGLVCLAALGWGVSVARVHHRVEYPISHTLAKKSCGSTAKMRFAQGGAEYEAGCKAAGHYVQGRHIGEHSQAWNQGFSDCRFNVYRSKATEIQAEKTICGYSPCYR